MLNATQLADRLGVSKARVSQYLSEGKLVGCYEGEGRSRRFDLSKVQAALQGRLDPGQMLGNGASTKRALTDLGDPGDAPADMRPRPAAKTDGALSPRDPDRYELARIQNAEEDARRKRRDNERDEGRWVLAEEVERSTAKLLSREIGQFETVIRDGARAIADRLGVDFREARQILMQVWRAHRGERAEALSAESQAAPMTEAEQEANG
ncbi:hypothetical protein GCM10010991_07660 [Gemmobacter aquaticus]|uniref:Helix-turn-helix domain-containing protein n=1 Tax=Gemmobacter aquaticus TaxID=490185 RepID=A0A918DBT3_9RHOB|nr:helix-turn-helix domain-containing protein [Gemmobacter aquaticus]GGO26727.1 hypothetical protein GCM10010991_07660 [Gemmobacter aquaticus]